MTGNTTLSKMQEIVSKHEVSHTASKPSQKHSQQDLREVERQLQEKDHTI